MNTRNNLTITEKQNRFHNAISIARNSSIPSELWNLFYSYRNLNIYKTIADNKFTPVDLLETLANTDNYSKRLQKPISDRTIIRKTLNDIEVKKFRENRKAIITGDYIYVQFTRQPKVKDFYPIFLAIASNPNATDNALRHIHNTSGLWVLNPTRKDVSLTAQLCLLKTIKKHSCKPEYIIDRLYSLIKQREQIKQIIKETKLLKCASSQTASLPQKPVVQPVQHLSFEDEMDADFENALLSYS